MSGRRAAQAVFFILSAVAPVTSLHAGESPERPRFLAKRSASIQPAAARATDSPAPATTPAPRLTRPVVTADAATDEGLLAPVFEKLRASKAALDVTRDYTCRFDKQEFVGRKMLSQSMTLKFRKEPFSVYMLYDGAERGREVMFVEGRMQNRVLVHEAIAVLGNVTIPLALNAPEITRETRYPFTTIGLHKLTQVLTAELTREVESGASDITVEEFPGAKLTSPGTKQVRVCHAFRMTFATPQKDRRFSQSIAYFDRQTGMLTRVENFGFPRREGEKPGLLEQYTYSNIEPNVGLTDQDFDPRNRAYHFQ